MNTWSDKKLFILPSIIVLLPLLPLLFGYFPAIGDMRDVFIPLESFFREEQLQGNVPAWNPAASFGFPMIAAAQIGFFYPILFFLRFLPIYLELPIAIILHIAAAAIGMFLFSRKLKLSNEAALLAAICFTLSQFIWQHITHLNIFLAVTWFPWQMLTIHTIFQQPKITLKNIATLSLLFGIPFLIGQLQIQLLMMIVALIYGLILRIKAKFHFASTVLSCLLLTTVSLLIASVQLLPTLELARLSSRATAEGFSIERANQHSYPLYHLPTLLFPRFYGADDTYWGKRLEIEYGSYIGVIPLMLVIWFIWNRKRLPSFWIYLGFGTFLLSLGSLSPFRLIGIEPSLWFFSGPARWLLFTTFAASVIAGFALDTLKNDISSKKFFRNAIIIITGILIGNIGLYFGSKIVQPTTYKLQLSTVNKLSSLFISTQATSISLLSPYTYITILSLIALVYSISHKNEKKIILIATAVDLILISVTTTPFVSWQKVLEVPATVSRLPKSVLDHNARIMTVAKDGDTGAYFTNPTSRPNLFDRVTRKNVLVPLISSQFGIYGTQWPASLDIREQTDALSDLHLSKAKELNIGAVIRADQDNTITVTPIDAKPRVEFIGEGEANIISEKPSELIVQTKSSQDSILIVRDTFYPGWHAYVDDKEVGIEKQEPFFRKIAVPAGEHVVTMRYISKTLYVGGFVTLILLLICAIIAL